MSSRDQDLLDRLFEVEKKAEALVAEAKAEADRRIAAAKLKSEAELSTAFEGAVKAANEKKAKAVETTLAEYEKAIAGYRATVEATGTDQVAFTRACESALNKK
jgi:vacuolar-type H+-ATPase subunit H